MNRQQRRAATRQGATATPAASPGIQDIFAAGLRHHQAGRLREAELGYRQVLAANPRHADSLHLLGLLACDARRPDIGADLIGKAIAINPKAAAYHFDLATIFQEQGKLEQAAACYHKATVLEPGYLEAQSNLGCLLQELGRSAEAVACHRKALSIQPNNAATHNNLGIALQALYQFADAVACYRRAIALRPDFADAYSHLGSALKEQGLWDEALASFRKALELDPNAPTTHANLGMVWLDQGRFEDATAAFETALRLGGDPSSAYHGLSIVRKFTEADRPLIAQMEAALTDPALKPASRLLIHFALGKAFDDLKDYESAIRHFDEGNRLEREKSRFDRAGFTALVDWVIAAFPNDAPASPAASASELPIFIVGMPRSGTTLVEQILASHPKVGAGGELRFWPERMGPVRRRQAARLDPAAERDAAQAYPALLGEIAPGAARVTDKMPFNFQFLGHLNRLLPQARFIHCRRNPIDTALSNYVTRFAAPHDFSTDRADLVYYYREYERLMAHWRAILPADRFLEIDYEALVADPETVSRRMVAFCGLDWDDACLAFHETDRPIQTASAWQARQPVYRSSAERWRRYEPWLGELRALLPSENV